MNPDQFAYKKRVILLVEDNPTDELLTVRALKKSNVPCKIDVVRDGSEALDYIFGTGSYTGRDPNDLPNFILLDIKLPKIDGLKVLERLRANERTRLVPVIVLTSSKEESDLLQSYRLGANSYVQKPVDYEEFSRVAQQLGIYWFMLNELPRFN